MSRRITEYVVIRRIASDELAVCPISVGYKVPPSSEYTWGGPFPTAKAARSAIARGDEELRQRLYPEAACTRREDTMSDYTADLRRCLETARQELTVAQAFAGDDRTRERIRAVLAGLQELEAMLPVAARVDEAELHVTRFGVAGSPAGDEGSPD